MTRKNLVDMCDGGYQLLPGTVDELDSDPFVFRAGMDVEAYKKERREKMIKRVWMGEKNGWMEVNMDDYPEPNPEGELYVEIASGPPGSCSYMRLADLPPKEERVGPWAVAVVGEPFLMVDWDDEEDDQAEMADEECHKEETMNQYVRRLVQLNEEYMRLLSEHQMSAQNNRKRLFTDKREQPRSDRLVTIREQIRVAQDAYNLARARGEVRGGMPWE